MSNPMVFAIKDSNGSLLSLTGSDGSNIDWARVKPEENDKNLFHQLWLVEDVPNSNPKTYKIRSLASGKVLTVAENWYYGNNINGNNLYGASDESGLYASQQWQFENLSNGKHLTTSFSKGTALESYKEGDIQWAGVSNVTRSESQSWVWECRSRTSSELESLVKASGKAMETFSRQHYAADGTYVNMPAAVRQEIWTKSLLGWKDGVLRKYPWRNQIFDCDDFAVVMKAETAKWAAENLKSDFFTLLMGICWGENPNAPPVDAHHAFNWYLTPDLKEIMWYEPQTGTEHADAKGYKIYHTSY